MESVNEDVVFWAKAHCAVVTMVVAEFLKLLCIVCMCASRFVRSVRTRTLIRGCICWVDISPYALVDAGLLARTIKFAVRYRSS